MLLGLDGHRLTPELSGRGVPAGSLMARVAVSIPHQLGQEEGKRRNGTPMRKVHALGDAWSQRWTRDYCLSFEGQLHGHAVAGELTGQPLGPTVRAEHTVTFVAPKKGFAEPAARAWLGQVHVVDIGAPRRLLLSS
jgi:hypothetical protein